jgi:predicted phage terminase large subunit-like protein
MFERRWFEIVDAAPAGLHCVRAWDLAGTVPKAGSDPDWTAGVKMGRAPDGFFYIADVVRFRATPKNVETTIKNTASQDKKRCRIRLPQDPGQAGKSQAQSLIRMLAGYVVKAVPPTGSKEARATPFSAQAEAGNVKLVEGAVERSRFFAEMELFPFGGHDDQVDAASDAFDELAEGSSGFLELVQEEVALAAEKAAEAEKETAAAEAGDGCPYPRGSVEWLRHYGLMQ